MVSSFICGFSNLPKEEDDLYRQTRSADSSPRRHCRLKSSPSSLSSSSSSSSSSKSKTNKNPYSNRGLDKFSALLAEIEEKRQKVYSQIDPDEISLVRFKYTPDHTIKPIVVKVKHNPKPQQEEPKTTVSNGTLASKVPSPSSMAEDKDEHHKCGLCGKACMQLCQKVKGYHWNEPKLYLPVVIILILVFLVFFGRAFVIMCTSIGWYVIPTIANNEGNLSYLKRSLMKKKKKDYAVVRRLSNKKLGSDHHH